MYRQIILSPINRNFRRSLSPMKFLTASPPQVQQFNFNGYITPQKNQPHNVENSIKLSINQNKNKENLSNKIDYLKEKLIKKRFFNKSVQTDQQEECQVQQQFSIHTDLNQELEEIERQIVKLNDRKGTILEILQLNQSSQQTITYTQTNNFQQTIMPEMESEENQEERYVGNKIGDIKEGFGTLFDDQGDIIYEGEWFQDQYHGRGRLRNQLNKQNQDNNGLVTEIEKMIVNQKMNNLWTTYEGEFDNGEFNGIGVLQIGQKHKFHGKFVHGLANGRGTIIDKDSKVVQVIGEYKDGALINIVHKL